MKKTPAMLALLAAAAAVGARADTLLTQFTAGDFVVMRGGDAAQSQNSYVEVAAYLDEYTTAGVYVGTLPINSNQLTLPSVSQSGHEGVLNLSPNGQWLAFAGYELAPSQDDTGGGDAAIPRKIGLVGNDASTLNTTTVVHAYDSNVIRSAVTLDGQEFWTAGKYPNGGLTYVSGVGPTATTSVLQPTYDWRTVNIFNGQLYGGTGSSSVGKHGAYQIDTGIPTSGTPSITQISTYIGGNAGNGNSASNLAFVTISGAPVQANGFNVLYTVGDEIKNNITKYYFDNTSGNWIPAGGHDALLDAITNPTGLIATVDPNNSSWVDLTVSGYTGVFTYIDKSGDPTAPIPDNAFSLLFGPTSSDEGFYGVAMAPAAASVTGYWTHSGANNLWSNNPANWTGGYPATAGSTATFDDTHPAAGAAGGIVTLGGGKTIGSLLFSGAASYQIGATGGADTLTLSNITSAAAITSTSSASQTIAAPIVVSGNGNLNITIGGASMLALTGGINVPAGGQVTIMSAPGSGTVSFSGTMTYGTGAVMTVGGGTVVFASPAFPPNKLVLNLDTLTNKGTHVIVRNAGGFTFRPALLIGYNGGAWNYTGSSPGVITSTSAAAANHQAIGYLSASDYNTLHPGNSAGLSGLDMLFSYTWAGDADLDGRITLSDYALIDAGFLLHSGTSWLNGDFDYNGTIDYRDYAAIDMAFSSQSGTLADAMIEEHTQMFGAPYLAALSALSPAPEPTSLALLGTFAALSFTRRRNHSKHRARRAIQSILTTHLK